VFLVRWKSGDKTWLPYCQITHLNALSEYFELQGIDSIEYLWEGPGHPPKDDIQNYIGALHIFRGCNYKRIPSRMRHPSFCPDSSFSPLSHVLSHQHPAPHIPRPAPPMCQPRVLLAAHKRDNGQYSQWATTGVPFIRPGPKG
jgi:hypothetical protein